MSDISVSAALRSAARLVVIEAAAGCGKTFQGAAYALHSASTINDGRVLIITHTHAACDVFASRTRGSEVRVDIRTIDSLIGEIAAAYHQALGLPSDTAAWARSQKDGYNELAIKVAKLLRASPIVGRSLAQRYPVVICDEHQDASAAQHSIVMACHEGGAALRIFGDPMQRIYRSRKKVEAAAEDQLWENLKERAEVFDELDTPHRWINGSEQLGQWILAARTTLRNGGQIDLRATLPQGITLHHADNQAVHGRGGYQLATADARPIYALERANDSLFILASQNVTVGALRSFFG